jgi:hypothetical protein
MKTFISSLAALTLLLAVPGPVTGAETAILWDGSQADFFSDTDGPFTLGFQFRVESNLTVTALGAYDYLGDGFATAHAVGLWTVDGGAPIATVTIPAGAGGSLDGQFRYQAIPGISLFANTEYIIGASELFGTINDIYGSVPVLAFSPSSAISFQGSRGAGEAPGLVFPTRYIEPLSPTTFGANFQYVVVPEPSTWALLGLGLILFGYARRHKKPVQQNDPAGEPPLFA